MTITVTDDIQGVEIHLGASELEPEKTNVVIFGHTAEAVQSVIFDLAEEYDRLDFQGPTFSRETNRWGALGRVW